MKKAILLLACLGLIACNQIPQSGNDAYIALKKLEAKTQTGINYVDYLRALGDAKFAVNSFLGEKSASGEFAKAIEKTMELYEEAAHIWQVGLGMKDITTEDNYFQHQALVVKLKMIMFSFEKLITDKEWEEFLEELQGTINTNNWIIRQDSAGKSVFRWNYKKLLPLYWGSASNQLKAAGEALGK